MNLTKNITPSGAGKKSIGPSRPEVRRQKISGKAAAVHGHRQHTTKMVLGRVVKPTLIEIRRAISFPTPPGSMEKGRILDLSELSRQIKNFAAAKSPPSCCAPWKTPRSSPERSSCPPRARPRWRTCSIRGAAVHAGGPGNLHHPVQAPRLLPGRRRVEDPLPVHRHPKDWLRATST